MIAKKLDENVKVIDNSEYINNLFRKLAKLREMPVMIQFDGENEEIETTMIFDNRIGTEMSLDNVGAEQELKITLQFKSQIFDFNVKPDSLCKFQMPSVVNFRSRRTLERHNIKSNVDVYFSFNKFVCKVKNINTKGFALEAPKRIAKVGQIIKDIRIVLTDLIDDKSFYVDGEVKYLYKSSSDTYIHGICFSDIHWLDKLHIIEYILKDKHLNLSKMGNFSKEEIYELFDKSGYLDINKRGYIGNFDEMMEVLYNIDDTPNLSKSFVYLDDNKKILSGASIMKLYNNTFLAQHLAAIKEARLNIRSKMDIYEAIINYMLNYEHFKYYLAYFDTDLEWHGALYKKIVAYVNNDENVAYEELKWFVVNISDTSVTDTDTYSVEKLYDTKEFTDYAKSNISSLERGCYCYNEEDINLENLKRIYEVKNLYVDRKIFKVTQNSKVIAYCVSEMYTTGINFYNLADTNKIFFTTTDNININHLLNCLIPELNNYYNKHNKKYYYVIISPKYDLKFDDINVPNMKKCLDFGRVMANYEGVVEYKNYFKTLISSHE